MRGLQSLIEASPTPADAVKSGYFNQVRYLLELGHHPNERQKQPDGTGRTPLMLCCLITDPLWSSSLARNLLEKGAKVGLRESQFKLNALHFACIYRRPHLVQLFLRAIDYPLDAADQYGNTALHHAAVSGDVDVVGQIIRALKQYDFSLRPKNCLGMTPLMCAWTFHRVDVANYLKQSINDKVACECECVCECDNNGKTEEQYEKEAFNQISQMESHKINEIQYKRLRYYQVNEWQKHHQQLRHDLQTQAQREFRSWKIIHKENNVKKSLLVLGNEREKQSHNLSVASELEVRNVPAKIFAYSPEDLFTSATDFSGSAKRGRKPSVKSGLTKRRVQSAIQLSSSAMDLLESTPMKAPRPSTAIHLTNQSRHSSSIDKSNGMSWRNDILKMFRRYERQFSNAYYPPAIPQPMDATNNVFNTSSNVIETLANIKLSARRSSILSNRKAGSSAFSGSINGDKFGIERPKATKTGGVKSTIPDDAGAGDREKSGGKTQLSKKRSGTSMETKMTRAISRADI